MEENKGLVQNFKETMLHFSVRWKFRRFPTVPPSVKNINELVFQTECENNVKWKTQ